MTIENFSNRRELVSKLEAARKKNRKNDPVSVRFPGEERSLEVYPASVRNHPKGGVLLSGRYNDRDALFVLGRENLRVMKEYDGEFILRHSDFAVMKCRWSRTTARKIREDFPQYSPISGEKGQVSISFGDVLGHAAKAQLRAFKDKAELAFSRQCFHQLEKLDIHPEDALDVVTRTVFQEGYEGGYAAEACHLTTPEQVRTMLDAGYTRFSLEPSGQMLFSWREKPKKELLESMFEVPWVELRDKFELMFNRYKGNRIDLGPVRFSEDDEQNEPVIIMPGEAEILAAIRMFSEIIIQVIGMEKVMVEEGRRDDLVLEISFARSEGALTPFELFFLVTELLRHDVIIDYVAPGDLTAEHWTVARNTRLTGLSGSVDHLENIPHETSGLKFHGVIEDISYLTAVQCMSELDPVLFREIWTHSRNVLEQVRQETELDIPIQKIPPEKDYGDENLAELISVEGAGLFLRHTMKEVFAQKDEQGRRYLRTAVLDFIKKHEQEYTDALVKRYQQIADTNQ